MGPFIRAGGLFFLANETTGKSTKPWRFRCSGSTANPLELLCRNPASIGRDASPDTYRQTRLVNRVETKGCQLCKAHPTVTELILMNSDGGEETNRSDLEHRHTEVRDYSRTIGDALPLFLLSPPQISTGKPMLEMACVVHQG